MLALTPGRMTWKHQMDGTGSGRTAGCSPAAGQKPLQLAARKPPKCLQLLLQTLTLLELDTLQVQRVPQHVAAPGLILLGEEQQVGVDKESHLEAQESKGESVGSSPLGTETVSWKRPLPWGEAPGSTGSPDSPSHGAGGCCTQRASGELPSLGRRLLRLVESCDRRDKPARQFHTTQTHPPCSLLSLPTYTSYKSEQEEGISCSLIPAQCRSCSLKANLITLITLTEELLTVLSEKVKFGFHKSRTHREQLQWTNLAPQTTVGVERKHQPQCLHRAVLKQCLVSQGWELLQTSGKSPA